MNLLAEDLDHVLAHTRELWEDLREKRLFLTGGTGFFGCWLLESFLWADEQLRLGASATVLTRDPGAFARRAPRLAASPKIHLLAGDVRSFEFPRGEFPHVIHAATAASAALNDAAPEEMFDTIVRGTERTLDFAVQAGATRFLLTSSGAVYGPQPPDLARIPEEYPGAPDPLDPASAYGEGKRAAELLCALYHRRHGMAATIARCFAFVGPWLPLDAHFAIGNFIRDALNGGPIRVFGDGTPYRSYLYAADLAVWLWTILFRGQPCRPYNVGSDEALSIAETARIVATAIEPCPPVQIAGAPQQDARPTRYVPSIDRAYDELGLVPWVSLKNAISKTCCWHLGRSTNLTSASEITVRA